MTKTKKATKRRKGQSASALLGAMLTADDVRSMVTTMLTKSTQKELAENLGISLSYLNDYLHFRRAPGAKLLDELGIQRVVLYRYVAPNGLMSRPATKD